MTIGICSGVPFITSSAANSMMVETGANSSWSTSSLQTTAALLVGLFGRMHASKNCAQAMQG